MIPHTLDGEAVLLQYLQGPVEVPGLGQDIVSIECRNGKDADAGVGQKSRDPRQDADEREIKYALDAERTPTVLARRHVRRDQPGLAHQGFLFVRLADEYKLLPKVDGRKVFDLAYGEFFSYYFQ